jgi:cytoskeletal protein CcmA (bactofilin family)
MAFGKFRDKPLVESTQPTNSIVPSVPATDALIKPLAPVKASQGNAGTAFIGSAASIVGTLKFDSSAEIGAYVEGEIHSTARLTILETGVIKGSITGADLIIKGKVQGNLKASNSIALCKPACVTGDITTPNLSMESGVIFEGKCSMPEIKTSTETPVIEPVKTHINNVVSNN